LELAVKVDDVTTNELSDQPCEKAEKERARFLPLLWCHGPGFAGRYFRATAELFVWLS